MPNLNCSELRGCILSRKSEVTRLLTSSLTLRQQQQAVIAVTSLLEPLPRTPCMCFARHQGRISVQIQPVCKMERNCRNKTFLPLLFFPPSSSTKLQSYLSLWLQPLSKPFLHTAERAGERFVTVCHPKEHGHTLILQSVTFTPTFKLESVKVLSCLEDVISSSCGGKIADWLQ